MSIRATAASAFALAILGVPNGALAYLASAPQSGTFQAQLYVNSTGGSGCLDAKDDVFLGSMSFAGLNGTTHYLRLLETGPGAAFDSVYTLTVKSGKGTTTPSGSIR